MKVKLLFIATLITYVVFSQNYKGMYVDKFHTILGNQVKEDSLFNYIEANHFNAISLYDLHQIDLTNTTKRDQLKAFIAHLRSDLNVMDVAAVAENFWFFENKILPYNVQVNENEKFTVFNLEFEFWVPESVADYYCVNYLQINGFSCDEAGAFGFYMQELNALRNLCNANNLKTEIYLGWFDQTQANEMVAKVDRILLSNYNANPSLAYDYSESRLQFIGNTNIPVEVAGLFSAEPIFLQPWIYANEYKIDSAYQIFQGEYNFATGTWKNSINLVGQHWFTYSVLPYFLPEEPINPGLGIKDIIEEVSLEIYPNPSNNFLTLKNFTNDKSFKISNLDGKIISNYQWISNNSIDISKLENGIYIIKSENKKVLFVKN